MPGLNYVVVAGSLTRDPELRPVSGTSVANLRLAIDEKFRDVQGNVVDKPVFVDVEIWGPSAEECARNLRKGSAVLIEGRLRLDQWEDKQGRKRTRLLVRALSVEPLR